MSEKQPLTEKQPLETPKGPVGLTDEEIAAEAAFMEGVPYLNIGALLMPPIWGPGHGQMITILFYPLWIFCDNVFYAAYSTPSPLSIAVAIVVFITMALFTFVYGRLSQPRAWHRAHNMGKTKEQYLATERKWAVGMAVVALVFLVLATWYNLFVKAGL